MILMYTYRCVVAICRQYWLLNNPKTTVHWNTQLIEFLGKDKHVRGIRVQNTQTGDQSNLAMKGWFYIVGHTPNTSLPKGQL